MSIMRSKKAAALALYTSLYSLTAGIDLKINAFQG